ncbi:hypothetical protein B0H12DRAFT_1081025 [Mycena haematopus]|nr:hypothetical protein B0H12DRAFT_1081025 [Mycena haematopus]
MSDDSFFPSSPSTVYSLGLEFEQSQHKQEIRDALEAGMTREERESADEYRRKKRIKLGFESPNYKKGDSSPSRISSLAAPESPTRTPRASAVKSGEKTSSAFLPHGLLDSQATSQQAVDAWLLSGIKNASQLFTTLHLKMSLSQLVTAANASFTLTFTDDTVSQELEGYQALHTRCIQAEMERDEALAELNNLQSAYDDVVTARSRVEGELAHWQRAAAAAAPLLLWTSEEDYDTLLKSLYGLVSGGNVMPYGRWGAAKGYWKGGGLVELYLSSGAPRRKGQWMWMAEEGHWQGPGQCWLNMNIFWIYCNIFYLGLILIKCVDMPTAWKWLPAMVAQN